MGTFVTKKVIFADFAHKFSCLFGCFRPLLFLQVTMLVNSSDNTNTVDKLAETKAHTDPVRSAVRFPIHLPIIMITEAGQLSASTIDISACGLLFSADRTLPVDSRVEFNIPMPSAVLGTESDVVVRCIGRVVRSVNHETSSAETAVVIDEYSFRT
jgi:hypothetical protein